MNITYAFDERYGIVRMRWEGAVAMTDWAKAMDQLRRDPRFRPGQRFLSDRRFVTQAPTIEEIRLSVDYFSRHRESLGRTIWAVITVPGADFGMIRMGETLANDLILLNHFPDVESAEAWLLTCEPPAS